MNATQKFALERDAFERASFGLAPREFANASERDKFARDLVAREAARTRAVEAWLDEAKQKPAPPARHGTVYISDGKVVYSNEDDPDPQKD